MPGKQDREEYDRFVEEFTDPNKKDLAIALTLKDLANTLNAHVSNHEEFAKSLIARFDRIELEHKKDTMELWAELRRQQQQLTVIERQHEREAAIAAKDDARLVWLNRVFGGVIGSALLYVAFLIGELLKGHHPR